MDIPAFRKKLLRWYNENKRDLPFRRTQNPYHIWLSEIMLQQTTVNTVIPYFENFISTFKTPHDVAQASEESLLKAWQGLGYYSRVRNFKKTCEILVKNNMGKLPKTSSELVKLPGIGPYTAAAISSIAFGEKSAVVDGNVIRVLVRLFKFQEDITKKKSKIQFQNWIDGLLDPQNPGDFNQAMMELGAVICKPKRADCLICPVMKHCQAAGQHPPLEPQKPKTKYLDVRYIAWIYSNEKFLVLTSPHSHSLVPSHWDLPLVPTDSKKISHNKSQNFLGSVRHGITNRRFHIDVYRGKIPNNLGKNLKIVYKNKIKELNLSTITRKILSRFAEDIEIN